MLVARDVTLTYDTEDVVSHAVDHASLSVQPREFVGLVGPSGSGKSSLLYILAGLKLPTGGSVWFRDTEFSHLGRDARANIRQRHFGFIFQQHFLISYLAAIENVLVAVPKPSDEDRTRALALLERLGMGGHLHKFPHQLSGGQRQRVAAARALMHRPDIIFADEPTASLDHRTAFELMALIEQTRQEEGTALVVVTHDPSVLGSADQVFEMWDGRLRIDTEARGAPDIALEEFEPPRPLRRPG